MKGLDEGKCVPVINGNKDQNSKRISDRKISVKFGLALWQSFKDLQKGQCISETMQIRNMMKILKLMLQICGYDCNLTKNHHDLHFHFMKQSEEKIIIHGEAKQVMNLPQKPMHGELSVHLCMYGLIRMDHLFQIAIPKMRVILANAKEQEILATVKTHS